MNHWDVPKPGIDSVLVTVVPPLHVFAGNDTSIVIGQPLQLNAVTNGTHYNWTPATGMNNPSILNPVIVLEANTLPAGAAEIRYLLNVSAGDGCTSNDDIVVRLFNTLPSIFVPNAFTPNQDGKNDDIKPILAGMKQLIYFRIYNRYGQLLFETRQVGRGWDGKVKGILQNNSAFVFDCQAEDYTGSIVHRTGTFVLVR
jgi:gliding motility-associated-like protein